MLQKRKSRLIFLLTEVGVKKKSKELGQNKTDACFYRIDQTALTAATT